MSSPYTLPIVLALFLGVPFLWFVVITLVQGHQRDRAWQQLGGELGLGGHATALSRPRLNGVYRGRATEAWHHGGYLEIVARAANDAHLLDEIRSSAPLPDAPWLSAAARSGLTALKSERGRRRWWKVRVQDQRVTLTFLGTETDAALLRDLLDLACDLAEGVDSVAPAPLEEPTPPRRSVRVL